MIKLSILEFFLRGIPESFVLVFTTFLFAKKSINKKAYFITGILYAVTVYLVRLLPIHLGVHTIIIAMIYVVISVLINKIPINKSIFYVLSEIIILMCCELINLFILSWLKFDIKVILSTPAKKILYFTPSLILFISVVLLFYVVICRIKGQTSKNVFNLKFIK